VLRLKRNWIEVMIIVLYQYRIKARHGGLIMKILGIDSSGIVASAAVADEENIVAEFTVNNRQTHSQTLLPMIDKVIKMAEIEPDELDAIAVASGPGSFTGLRIGSATAKGLGLALNKPIVPVPTLEGLAYRMACFDGVICPVMDARRNQVYTAAYCMADRNLLKVIIEQTAADIHELIKQLNDIGRKTIFLGDGVNVYSNVIDTECHIEYLFAPVHMSMQSAASIAVLGMLYFKEGRFESAAGHRPFYLRQPQAERERQERLTKKANSV